MILNSGHIFNFITYIFFTPRLLTVALFMLFTLVTLKPKCNIKYFNLNNPNERVLL